MKKDKIKKPAPKARKPRKANADTQIKRDLKKAKEQREKASLMFDVSGQASSNLEAEAQAILDDMLSKSNEDHTRHLSLIETLKGPRDDVSDVEVYSYTTFPAPFNDYLDYIKSRKNGLRTWSDLESFVKTTDGFWRTMRDQSCKIVLGFANDQIKARGEYFGGSYLSRMIQLYIDEVKREMNYNASKMLAGLTGLISDYDEHVMNITMESEDE